MKPSVPGRLHAHGLVTPRFDTVAEVVRHLGGVQSQLPDMAWWAVARRTRGLTMTQARAALDSGDVLRTHVLRPTWHLVAPADIHWLLELTAPRIRRQMSSSWKSMGLTPQIIERGTEVVVQALDEAGPLTRAELADRLEAASVQCTGGHLPHHLMNAEISRLVASGPMRGKQHTYARLAQTTVAMTHDELLAEVARRYGRGHGPFRDKDLAWWSSLTLTQSRRAVELAELRPLDVQGATHWVLDDVVETEVPRVLLLPGFDEYISYARDPEDYTAFTGSADDVMRGSGLLMLDGRLAGTWTRTVRARTVEVVVVPSARVTRAVRQGLEDETTAYGRFVERETRLVVED